MNIAISNKQFWMSNAIAIASLLGVILFPTNGGFQSIIITIAFLVVLPILFIRFFLREKLSFFGISWGVISQGILWLTLSLVFVIGALAYLYRYTDVLAQIEIPLLIRQKFFVFIIYIISTGVLFAAQEFFFRGFVLNIYRKIFGYGAILVQAIFAIALSLVRVHGNISIGILIVAIFSLYSGWIAFRSQSIWYSFLFFFVSAILGIAAALVFIK